MDVAEEPESKVIQLIRKKLFRPYDEKFVPWDLECTGNGREDGVHVCFVLGSWFVNQAGLGLHLRMNVVVRTLNSQVPV